MHTVMMRFPSCPIKYSDLCKKIVVNICDGSRLGYVSDLEIDSMCGRINALMVPQGRKLFSKACYHVIRWDQIDRIGEDAILVKFPRAQPPPKGGCC